jgi:uncharacterized protein (DUF2141 family)
MSDIIWGISFQNQIYQIRLNMKNYLLFLIGLMFISNFSFAQCTLTIEITNLRNNTGKLMLQVFDEKEKVIAWDISDIKDKKTTITVKDLKPGKYAVRFYHDENHNKVMETNVVGKPTEGYGFSNNVTGSIGPPPFKKSIFELNEDKTIKLKTVY